MLDLDRASVCSPVIESAAGKTTAVAAGAMMRHHLATVADRAKPDLAAGSGRDLTRNDIPAIDRTAC